MLQKKKKKSRRSPPLDTETQEIYLLQGTVDAAANSTEHMTSSKALFWSRKAGIPARRIAEACPFPRHLDKVRVSDESGRRSQTLSMIFMQCRSRRSRPQNHVWNLGAAGDIGTASKAHLSKENKKKTKGKKMKTREMLRKAIDVSNRQGNSLQS